MARRDEERGRLAAGFGRREGARRPAGARGRRDARASKGPTPARAAALEAVRILRERNAFAQDVMARVIDQSSMSREDRAFATLLVLGVVSTRGVLDEVLNRCMRTPHDVDDDVRDALQISAYELIYLDKSAHVAVDQGVELVASVAPRARGVANAVLRHVVIARDSFPFGDPATDLAACARLHGFPLWLAERLVADLGPQDAVDFMRTSNEPAPVFVSVNAVSGREEEAVEMLRAARAEPEPVAVNGRGVPGCYRIADGRVLVDGRVRRLINSGVLFVSDASSQAVAQRVLPDERPASFLEVGAGRATKTLLLQSEAHRRWGGQIAEYVTVDNRAFKTSLLLERVAAYGVNVSEALTGDATELDAVVGGRVFDAVFVDAPCTGLGTLRRHPEIRWRLAPEVVESYARLGSRLIASAADCVAPGGVLAYATCTTTPEENARVVAGFLRERAGAFELIPVDGASAFAPRLTSGGQDAHFLAIMRRVDGR